MSKAHQKVDEGFFSPESVRNAGAQPNGEGSDQAGKPKPRSPNHPVLDLKAAIDKAEQLHKEYGTHAVALQTFCKAFSYAMNSSGAIQLLAALKAYDLVAVNGTGDSRKIAVSPVADRIIRNAPNRKALIAKAALAPGIHEDVWEHYKEAGALPHNDILRQYLVWDRPAGARFTEDAVGPFIERLRATFAFAEIGTSAKMPSAEGGEDDGEPEDDDPPPPPADLRKEKRRMTTADPKEFVHDLKEGQAMLTYPRDMSPASWEELKGWLTFLMTTINRSVSEAVASAQRAKDNGDKQE
jgi:hypothetical protein